MTLVIMSSIIYCLIQCFQKLTVFTCNDNDLGVINKGVVYIKMESKVFSPYNYLNSLSEISIATSNNTKIL